MLARRRAVRFILAEGVRWVTASLRSPARRPESDMTTESTTTPEPAKDDATTVLPSQRGVEGAPPPDVPPATPDVPAEAPPPSRRLRWLPRYTWSGTLGALLLGWSSFTP